MKTFEHTAISKSIYMVNLKYMVYPACKMVSDLSDFFLFILDLQALKTYQSFSMYCNFQRYLYSRRREFEVQSHVKWSLTYPL